MPQYQLRNPGCFKWTNGSLFLDNSIHDLDLCCWAKGSYPVSAQGMGGRQTRNAKCDQFDHCAIEYTVCRRNPNADTGAVYVELLEQVLFRDSRFCWFGVDGFGFRGASIRRFGKDINSGTGTAGMI
ncbi:MAG: hypothetical protein LBF88_03720 [Planctomycetaceae bacterium]|nr:hypothetical protein [Planctomycetaceae bacterium]